MTELKDYAGKRLHFIGIGGTGMSALARILRSKGYNVTGSDKSESPFTAQLVAEGVAVAIGQKAENVHGADVAIYSAAIKKDNPERAEAELMGIPMLERSEALGQLSKQYKEVIAIAGCHGKTTITSMLAKIDMAARMDATVHLGGFVDFMDGGVLIGKSDLFITEACEYVESFMHLRPTIALINNIDDDHLDYYRDIDHIAQTFFNFTELLPQDGVVFGCVDDDRVLALLDKTSRRTVSYGLTRGRFTAKNLNAHNGGTEFDVCDEGKPIFHINLSVPGDHNVLNALAATVVALHLGVSPANIQAALADYTLTRRRFEYYGVLANGSGAKVYHDYAHHPNEIRACLQGARSVAKGKLYAVFQCNSYTRAKTLYCNNVTCFKDADFVLIPDIYPGRETDDGSVHAKDMAAAINKTTGNAIYLENFENIRDWLNERAVPGDLIVTLGSGDVYIQTKKFL